MTQEELNTIVEAIAKKMIQSDRTVNLERWVRELEGRINHMLSEHREDVVRKLDAIKDDVGGVKIKIEQQAALCEMTRGAVSRRLDAVESKPDDGDKKKFDMIYKIVTLTVFTLIALKSYGIGVDSLIKALKAII